MEVAGGTHQSLGRVGCQLTVKGGDCDQVETCGWGCPICLSQDVQRATWFKEAIVLGSRQMRH